MLLQIDPTKYKTARSFIIAFINENRANRRRFSMRVLSRELNWPLGLASDIIANRKGFSVNRAIQICEYFDYTAEKKNRLILLALKSLKYPVSDLIA